MGKNPNTVTDKELELQIAAMGGNPDLEVAPPAPPTPAETPKDNGKELVDIPIATFGQEETLVITVNGKNYTMDRGKSYLLPKAVAAEYRRSVQAASRAHKRKAELQNKEKEINAHADAVIAGKVAAD